MGSQPAGRGRGPSDGHGVAQPGCAHSGGSASATRDEQTGERVDFAHAVWNSYVAHLAHDHFFDSRQGVDWYHATEHLAHAASLLKGEGTAATHQWFEAQETLLFEGHADQIAAQLLKATRKHATVADGLRREAGCFQDNHPRMQYQEFREDGFPIGSGMVESDCKRFRKRFTGTGMRWSRPCIERLIPIRAAIMGRQFDQVWLAACKSPQN